jgi:hypothetical protein
MNVKSQVCFWRAVLGLTVVFALAGMVQMAQAANGYGIQILHSTWIYLFAAISSFVLFVLALLALTWTRWITLLLGWPEAVIGLDKWWRIIAGFVLVALPCIFSIAVLHPYLGKYYFPGLFTRLALFWCLALTGMFCLRIFKKELFWVGALGVSVLILAVFYRMAVVFSFVSDYPFARGWSEVSRFYGASLFLSQRLYGHKIPLSLLHPAWHLLLTPTYLLGNMPIWVHRLWQAALQVGLTGALGLAVVKRLKLHSRLQIWLTAGWAFLFLMQGPILVHLLFCALIVILGVKPERFWRTTLTVLVASVWAGWCRINWFPVPALMASVIYLLEIPVMNPKRWLAYLWKPVLWFSLGTLVAFASNFLFVNLSGNGSGGNFASSLTSEKLWYRLLPNFTYPHGVLLDLLLVSAPPILIIFFTLRQASGALHSVRLVGIFGILLILCAGGVVVSTKIGGGSDLHNMDAYLILLLLVAAYLFFDVTTPEHAKAKSFLDYQRPVHLFLTILGLTVPVWFAMQTGQPVFIWDRLQADQELYALKSQAETVSSQGGEVLFISQRQLLALKIVNVPLVPDYEQDSLMEMVMSQNHAYLDRFQSDLQAQRFALIVADEQNIHYYGKKGSFGEENDLWVQNVSIPLLCYYHPASPANEFGVMLYVPNEQPCK